jgi:queuine tRNA-ribosyltransferase
MMLPFTVTHADPDSAARTAELDTPHGVVHTPAFMPVGTAGTVKGVAAWELERLAPEMVLANTYHLLLRPGVDRVERLGGLHRVLGWSGPVLTDSGGYQVFSLADSRRLDDDGVSFRSHLDGTLERLTPRGVIEAQARFGVDVAMVLDECPASDAPRDDVSRAVERSARWAVLGLETADRLRADGDWRGGVFAIQQGALDPELRQRSTQTVVGHDFDGFAVGGLAVGESNAALHEAVAMAAPMLPADRPRYLMGVGYPEDLLHAVAHGVDLFDCVLPTRSARTGKAFTSRGEVVIKNARWTDDDTPLDPHCPCPTCARYPKAVLRHLFVAREVTSVVLLTIHNLTYFLSLMREARAAIIAGRYTELRRRVIAARGSGGPDRGTADSAR